MLPITLSKEHYLFTDRDYMGGDHLKVITEQYVRDLLKEEDLQEFKIECGQILSPAARDYLNQMRIPFGVAGDAPPRVPLHEQFVDAATGEKYDTKPEFMTHLHGNNLVYKDHKRIAFRGALDHLQSQIVFAQSSLCEKYPQMLINDLENVLTFVRNILRAEVLNEPLGEKELLGLSDTDLRGQSHNPEKYFGVKAMTLPHYSMGQAYAHLNLLRSQSRQVEVIAVSAFRDGNAVSFEELILALNRLSSCFHILCCRVLSGYYCTDSEQPGTISEQPGTIQIEASARHVHLCRDDVEKLFGKHSSLTPARYLSQTGEFLCKERVTLVTERRTIQNVAVLGPERPDSQVELSLTDGVSLGLKLPVRDSGDIANTPGILLRSDFGEVELSHGCIAARRHIHTSPEDALMLGISDKQLVSVEISGDRRMVFENVLVRVKNSFCLRMHIDMDEANAAGVSGFALGRIK